jgi:hypothetical protein
MSAIAIAFFPLTARVYGALRSRAAENDQNVNGPNARTARDPSKLIAKPIYGAWR